MPKRIVSSKYIRGLKTRIRQIACGGGSAKICPSEIIASEAIRQQHLRFQEFPKQRRAVEVRANLAAVARRIEKSPHLNSRF
jgi:hypothetical protein